MKANIGAASPNTCRRKYYQAPHRSSEWWIDEASIPWATPNLKPTPQTDCDLYIQYVSFLCLINVNNITSLLFSPSKCRWSSTCFHVGLVSRSVFTEMGGSSHSWSGNTSLSSYMITMQLNVLNEMQSAYALLEYAWWCILFFSIRAHLRWFLVILILIEWKINSPCGCHQVRYTHSLVFFK